CPHFFLDRFFLCRCRLICGFSSAGILCHQMQPDNPPLSFKLVSLNCSDRAFHSQISDVYFLSHVRLSGWFMRTVGLFALMKLLFGVTLLQFNQLLLDRCQLHLFLWFSTETLDSFLQVTNLVTQGFQLILSLGMSLVEDLFSFIFDFFQL